MVSTFFGWSSLIVATQGDGDGEAARLRGILAAVWDVLAQQTTGLQAHTHFVHQPQWSQVTPELATTALKQAFASVITRAAAPALASTDALGKRLSAVEAKV